MPARDRAAGRRLVHFIGGALGAVALGTLLQLALAHPAGAATAPLSGLANPLQTPAASSIAWPVISALGQTVNGVAQGTGDAGQATTAVVQGAVSAVESTTAPVLADVPLAPVLGLATQPIDTVGGVLSSSAPGLPLPVGSRTAAASSATHGPASPLRFPVAGGVGTSTPTSTVPTGAKGQARWRPSWRPRGDPKPAPCRRPRRHTPPSRSRPVRPEDTRRLRRVQLLRSSLLPWGRPVKPGRPPTGVVRSTRSHR